MTLKHCNLSNGVMFPIYDPDTNLVYLCGKVSEYNYSLELEDNLILKRFIFRETV